MRHKQPAASSFRRSPIATPPVRPERTWRRSSRQTPEDRFDPAPYPMSKLQSAERTQSSHSMTHADLPSLQAASVMILGRHIALELHDY